jgi:tetratricopeptide (TPR) repeat protein
MGIDGMATAENPERLFAQAIDLRGMGKIDEAILHYEKAIALKPDFAKAKNNLGNLLQEIGKRDEAIRCYEQALAIEPAYAEAHMNLGNALAMVGLYEESMRHFETALALKPNYADALMNLGNLLQVLGRDEEALERFEQALAIRPDFAEAHMNLGITLRALGRYEDAIQRYDKAEALSPQDAKIKHNKGLSCLTLGRFAEGWELYEQRWAGVEGKHPRAYPQPRWKGGKVKGTLLVWGEQGLGDQVLFSSMVSELPARADSVVLEVEPRLVPLFARSFPRVDVSPMRPALYAGPVKAQIALGSLGQYLRPDWSAFPRQKRGYLVADHGLAKKLRARLTQEHPLVVGLSWKSGNVEFGKFRSVPLHDFAALFRLPDCNFVDLQYGETLDERVAVQRELGVEVARLPDIDNKNDIDALAALIAACDLVVTADNTTAHLAGALGKPTWMLAPHGHGRVWYWFTGRDDSPWYPRLRIARQQRGQSWADLIASAMAGIGAFAESLRAR